MPSKLASPARAGACVASMAPLKTTSEDGTTLPERALRCQSVTAATAAKEKETFTLADCILRRAASCAKKKNNHGLIGPMNSV